MILSSIWKLLLKIVDSISEKSKVRLSRFTISALRVTTFIPDKYSYPPRVLFSRLLPWNPLQGNDSLPLAIFILTTKKDIDVLPFSLFSVAKNIANPDSPITIVAPEKDSSSIHSLLTSLKLSQKTEVKSDESMLLEFGLARQAFPSSHSFMQILKFLCALSSEQENVVVLDGDTIFFRRRVWVTSKKITLVVPTEYERTHVQFVVEKFPNIHHSKLGFTTQAQVLRKSWVEEMIAESGGLKEFITLFTNAMREFLSGENLISFPCEWQVMGDWILTNKSGQIEFGSYLNISEVRSNILPRLDSKLSEATLDVLLNELSTEYHNYASLSLHAYRSIN
jgi:hypothetical protein